MLNMDSTLASDDGEENWGEKVTLSTFTYCMLMTSVFNFASRFSPFSAIGKASEILVNSISLAQNCASIDFTVDSFVHNFHKQETFSYVPSSYDESQ